MSPRLIALAAALVTLALAPAAAQAAVVTLDGDPLNISADEYGALQARFDGQTDGEFYPPTTDVANAGFHVALYDETGGSTLYGPAGNSFTPVDADEDGEPDTPILQRGGTGDQVIFRHYDAGTALRITELIHYRNGEREFFVQHIVENISDQPVRFSAAEFADLYLGGSDLGTGFFQPGPPRVVGGVTPAAIGVSRTPGGGLVDTGPTFWNAHEVNSLSIVRQHLSAEGGPAFDGSIVQETVDNAVGVQWDQHKVNPLQPGGEGGFFQVAWRFTDFPVPPPPPEVGESVNVEPTGTVRIKYPPGFVPPGPNTGTARAAQANKFQTITEPVQIPVGSTVDVRKGAVDMTSAADFAGNTQQGKFSKGLFRVAQRAAANPITDLRLTGGSFNRCRGRAGRAVAARVIRRLRGSARGRFRTRGRYGSATVRGTGWTLTESCAGTLVSVQSGKVVVRDFARKRNVTVRKGRSYLARPRR